MKKIAVFCSASETIDKTYFEHAAALGIWMGKQQMTLIYGGSDQGLMECLATAVKNNGGKLVGVVPDKLEENGHRSSKLDTCQYVNNLSERKDFMMAEADKIVALPGGVGTFDEIFHVIAACSIGYHHKKVIFYNINGYYNALLNILEGLAPQHFSRHPMDYYLQVANNLEELKELLTK